MNTLEANIRSTKTKGELNTLRSQGNVPAVIYGGQDKNQNISERILSSSVIALSFFKLCIFKHFK